MPVALILSYFSLDRHFQLIKTSIFNPIAVIFKLGPSLCFVISIILIASDSLSDRFIAVELAIVIIIIIAITICIGLFFATKRFRMLKSCYLINFSFVID